MLVNEEMFRTIEEHLRANGTIARFEEKQGQIRGRMMITLCDVPDGIEITPCEGEISHAFEASFDFYDCTVGFVLYTCPLKVGSGVWITEQIEGAEPPDRDWIDFFIKTVIVNIREDGGFGIPMYTFCADNGDFTVIPVSQEEADQKYD